MLTRFYVDNFRCLVNFELKLDRIALLLGENGAGKSTVFDALNRLQDFLLGHRNIRLAFNRLTTINRSLNKTIQSFELELEVGMTRYRYELTVDHEHYPPRVQKEILFADGHTAFAVTNGRARLQEDNGTLGEEFPCDPAQSIVGSFLSSEAIAITQFREEIEKFVICAIQPMNMLSKSDEEVRYPSRHMRDFVAWYRYLSQEYQGSIFNLNHELRAVLPGFQSFSLKEKGENVREMRVHFQADESGAPKVPYSFSELSDGQRSLIVLYTLLYGLDDRGAYLFVDEPENFIALREIQPWLTALYDRVGGSIKQAVLISHHPEFINYLGSTDSRWFDRTPNGYTRVSEQPSGGLDGALPLSELVARGWEK